MGGNTLDLSPLLLNLRAAVRANPTYRRAVCNLLRDIHIDERPHREHGNIRGKLRTALQEIRPLEAGAKVHDHVHALNADRKPKYRTPVANENQPDHLHRVVTLTDFIRYIWGGDRPENISRRMLQYYRQNLDAVRALLDRPEGWQGTTGRSGAPSWWCHWEGAYWRPSTGRHYVEALALPHDKLDRARKDGGVVEIIVPVALIAQVYKPCAIDGYGEDARFRPDISSSPWGWTAPDDGSIFSVPEIVSRTLPFGDLGNDRRTIRARFWRFNAGPEDAERAAP